MLIFVNLFLKSAFMPVHGVNSLERRWNNVFQSGFLGLLSRVLRKPNSAPLPCLLAVMFREYNVALPGDFFDYGIPVFP